MERTEGLEPGVRVNGVLLRALRGSRGLTQKELAVATGIAQSFISALETGKKTNAQLSTISKLAAALEVAPTLLLTGRPEEGETVLIDEGTGLYLDKRTFEGLPAEAVTIIIETVRYVVGQERRRREGSHSA